MSKKRVLILASGRGTNMEAILRAMDEGRIDGEAVGIISSNTEAMALKKGQSRGIETCTISRREYLSKADWEKALLAACLQFTPDLLCLAGFMHILGPEFVGSFKGRIMNIHPSLLPSFPGLHAQRQALDYGAKVSGCTVHFVDEGMDTGPIILQRAVPVYPEDTEDTLSKRILVEEHTIYPEAVRLFCLGNLRIEGRKVYIQEREESA